MDQSPPTQCQELITPPPLDGLPAVLDRLQAAVAALHVLAAQRLDPTLLALAADLLDAHLGADHA